ncbi:MAG: DUF4276 family protein [Thermoguttaceae bacterium]|nr:DUF4276 family protein [Thermoguttaceae bacterium]
MRVLVVAEGRHELGGALESLIRRLATQRLECSFERVSRANIHVHHGKGRGYFKKAIRWMLEGQKRDFDGVVLVIDQDNYPERKRELDDAQQHVQITSIPRALGVAIRSFDAWMLADERALASVLQCAVSAAPAPEEINDPKGFCATVLRESGRDLSQTEMYAAVASTAEISLLAQRCPRGFAPFADRVCKLQT